MIIIGGLANNKGVLIGTLVFVTIRKAIIYFKEYLESFVPFDNMVRISLTGLTYGL